MRTWDLHRNSNKRIGNPAVEKKTGKRKGKHTKSGWHSHSGTGACGTTLWSSFGGPWRGGGAAKHKKQIWIRMHQEKFLLARLRLTVDAILGKKVKRGLWSKKRGSNELYKRV